jgi:hypothetical protein
MSQSKSTTPEEYLSRTIRKEYRKEERDEYNRAANSTRSSYADLPRVQFVTGCYDPGYIVLTPGLVSVSASASASALALAQAQARAQALAQAQAQAQSQAQIDRLRPISNTYTRVAVPVELAARGIKAAENPRPRMSSSTSTSTSTRCNVPTCSISHSSHYCNVCGKWNVTHPEDDCPRYKHPRY